MPYFFILPVYLILVTVLGVAAALTRLSPTTKWLTGYVVAGTIGTLPGLIVANVVVTLAAVLPAKIASHFNTPEFIDQIVGLFLLLALFLGPFAASLVGVALGFAAGCLALHGFQKRRDKRLLPST